VRGVCETNNEAARLADIIFRCHRGCFAPLNQVEMKIFMLHPDGGDISTPLGLAVVAGCAARAPLVCGDEKLIFLPAKPPLFLASMGKSNIFAAKLFEMPEKSK
jgi:hypothetical protein